MANTIVGETCKGCGTRRGRDHCQYPSNPANNEGAVKNALDTDSKITKRRNRAHAITERNNR